MLQSIGLKQHDFIPAALYNLAWNEWYMVYAGCILVFNTISRYVQEPVMRT
jgi:ethanolaminephosphotransferase